MPRLRTPTSQQRLTKLRTSLSISSAALILAGLSVFTVFIANTYLKQSTELRTPADEGTSPSLSSLDVDPYLTISSLPNGKYQSSYKTPIEAISLNPQDKLSLTATHLPEGLFLSNCLSRASNNQTLLNCKLTGKPAERGTFYPTFILTSRDQSIVKTTLTLIVN